jgi:hypothetical protein
VFAVVFLVVGLVADQSFFGVAIGFGAFSAFFLVNALITPS